MDKGYRMSHNFDKRLEKVLGPIKEDTSPKLGVWYYLWMEPEWKLWTYEVKLDQKIIAHDEVWRILAQDIGEHYNLSVAQTDELAKHPYGLPRGRVDTTSDMIFGVKPKDDKIFVVHGDDFPSSMSKEAELKKIVSRFDLIKLLLDKQNNKVEIVHHEHEEMVEKDKELLQNLIGIPC